MSYRLTKQALGCIALLSVACTGNDISLATAGTGGAAGGSPGAVSGGPNAGMSGEVGGAAQSGGGAAQSGGGAAQSGGGAGAANGGGMGGGAAAPESEVGSFIDGISMGAGKCLPRTLPLNADKTPSCKVFAASASCNCAAAGRMPASAAVTSSVRIQLAAEGMCDAAGTSACSSFCACEVSEATGASEQDCLNNATPAATSTGWCYVEPAAGIGSAAVVSGCPSNEKQIIVFLGDAQAVSGEAFFLACSGGPAVSTPSTATLALGAPCIGGSEYDPSFAGFDAQEVSVDLGSPTCASGICLANHFQGRTSCPYGQTSSQSGLCFVPGSDTPVTAEVSPQLVARQAASASVCSCRCAGSGAGPFCSCGSGMECLPLIDDVGLPGQSAYAGSYCVPNGTAYDRTQLGLDCLSSSLNCGPARPD
jgi:hypothetical protein